MKNLIALFTLLLVVCLVCAQQAELVPDLLKVGDPDEWTTYNRKAKFKKDVYLNAAVGDGMVWINDLVFGNGKIELDIKGKDVQGRSFVGLAFHGLNDSTYDVIYFRPFNFRNPERNGHSVQYISHPEHTWFRLREAHPGKYENKVTPVPDPDDWFHAAIVIDYPVIKVFVNESEDPSLEIEQLSDQKKGWIGFWAGNGSDGNYRNLKILPAD
jgi:hypothetical protein